MVLCYPVYIQKRKITPQWDDFPARAGARGACIGGRFRQKRVPFSRFNPVETMAFPHGTASRAAEPAIAALSSSSYTLELLDETAWDLATPVYWAAGSESGYAATLADALTAAYKANGDITIVCRPGTDVGKLTHGHVADDITIYGNNAYISSGECELEVDTFMYSRDTGKQVTTGGAYLEKDITVTAYELDNLGVWGQRHTDHKVTVNLTDCDSVNGITVQRVYISGTTGVNDITLTGCDFGTRATSVYSNAAVQWSSTIAPSRGHRCR